ncbi:hypothetical protein AB0J01_41315 [Streptomyces sp. NPDC050204]|uniref:hypothetical protein n=1 Tax=Streptomyces sp. NPDC050204 TaxID=3155514 RepID=UPI00342DE826
MPASNTTGITNLRPAAETALLEHQLTGVLTGDPIAHAAAALLNSAGSCPCCHRSIGWEALRAADRALTNLVKALPTAADHHHVVSFPVASAVHLASLLFNEAPPVVPTDEGARLLLAMAAAVTLGQGGLVVRTRKDGEPDRVRGWAALYGRLAPLTGWQTFSAYCTDADTGEPIPPEPDTEYCDAFPLA